MRKSLAEMFSSCVFERAKHASANAYRILRLIGRLGFITATSGFFGCHSLRSTNSSAVFRPIPLMEDLEFFCRRPSGSDGMLH